jgi:hypothetical protein
MASKHPVFKVVLSAALGETAGLPLLRRSLRTTASGPPTTKGVDELSRTGFAETGFSGFLFSFCE